MSETPNHSYNVPNEGTEDWHEPLNDNFSTLDTDIEIRDSDSNKSDYEPEAGAKFFATDSEKIYIGDGEAWNPVESTGTDPTFFTLNERGTDLGVGRELPVSMLHVTDNATGTGSMDLSRAVAVIENDSGEDNGDMLALKTQVTEPGRNTDFLSFVGGSQQLAQLHGDGSGGIRLSSSNDLLLGSGNDTDHLRLRGGDQTVEVGGENEQVDLGVGTTSPVTQLHVTDDPARTGSMDLSRTVAVIENDSGEDNGDMLALKCQVSNPGQNVDFLSFLGSDQQIGQLQGDGSGGIALTSSGKLRLAADGTRVASIDGSAGSLDIEGGSLAFNEGGETFEMTPDTNFIPSVLRIRTGIFVDGSIAASGSKNFVQPVDTEDGEKEVVYTASEGPTPRTEVSGVGQLEDGRAEVELPEHFGWVTDEDEPLVVQTTPYGGTTGLKVVERSAERIVVEDLDGEGEYEFAYTVRGTREGQADKQVVREPTVSRTDTTQSASADD